jgi:hypothetical protein
LRLPAALAFAAAQYALPATASGFLAPLAAAWRRILWNVDGFMIAPLPARLRYALTFELTFPIVLTSIGNFG